MSTTPLLSRPLLSRWRRSAMMAGIGLALASGVSGGAQAADPQMLGTFGDWEAYGFKEAGGQVCYMASRPKKAEGDYTQRGDIFALVTHRPGEKTNNVFSVVAGYPYKDGSDVAVTIDRKTFTLFTQGDRAWARDAKTDGEIVAALRKGSSLVVKGTSQRGTGTVDTYSLRGTGNAYDAISKACNVKTD